MNLFVLSRLRPADLSGDALFISLTEMLTLAGRLSWYRAVVAGSVDERWHVDEEPRREAALAGCVACGGPWSTGG